MRDHRKSTRVTPLFVVWLFLACLSHRGKAQTNAAPLPQLSPTYSSQPGAAIYDFAEDRLPIVSLDGAWRFQAGDDPDGKKGFASPSFNDSSWRLVHAGKSWFEEPAAAFAGSAWYRVRLSAPAGTTNLAVYVPALFVSYQLFANGQLLGGIGPMPPGEKPATTYSRVYAMPLPPGTRSVVVALRVWRWPQWNYFYKFALPMGVQVGEARLIEQRRSDLARAASWGQVSNIILLVAELVFGFAALGLFWLRRTEYVNLWFAVMLLFTAAERAWELWPQSHSVNISTYYVVLQALSAMWRMAQIFFFLLFLKGKRDWLFWFAIVTTALVVVGDYPLFFPQYFPARLATVPIIAWIGWISALQAAPAFWVLTLLFGRVREGREDARLLFIPVVLKQVAPILFFIEYWGYYGFGWRPPVLAWLDEIATVPFSISYNDVAFGLFLVTMLAILIRRFVRTAAQEEDHQREREAARTVQSVLVPEENPVVAGFRIQSIYMPYGEVGGDFYQIVPCGDSSILITIGDVSGKGLPAAMTVALLVGAFRTLAKYHREPSEILTLMNQSLAGRSTGGFTTCLVLRADTDGTLAIANAGHIAPYLNGEELEQQCDLPLGIVEEITYTQASYNFGLNAQLTLLTDGVVEARCETGELFGFERTAAVTTTSAAAIAQSARDFGQDDDITVLNLVRVA